MVEMCSRDAEVDDSLEEAREVEERRKGGGERKAGEVIRYQAASEGS